MTYVHPGTLLSEIAKEHPEANEQDLLVMLINKLRELDDLQCWLDVSREWFGSQRQMLEKIRLSPDELAALAARKRERKAERKSEAKKSVEALKRFLETTPEQRERLKRKKDVS